MLSRIVRDVAAATGSPEEYVWVYLSIFPHSTLLNTAK